MSSKTTPTFTMALLAGGLAGTTVDLVLFPLDTLKTRLQSSSGFFATGGFTKIYSGVGSAIVGSAPGASLFFCTYEYSKNFLSRGTLDGWKAHMIAGGLGEVAACTVRVPTEVVKIRTQNGQHPSSLSALKAILSQRRTIGLSGVWRGLYRGWGITVFREVPFTVIQFPLWEWMKEQKRRQSGKDSISAWESGLAGSIAGGIAAAFTTPLDVLKTRSQEAKQKIGVVSLAKQIWKFEGPRAFFAGIGPRMFWISVGGAIFLGTYQWASNTMIERKVLSNSSTEIAI